jgi:hypothetical protein
MSGYRGTEQSCALALSRVARPHLAAIAENSPTLHLRSEKRQGILQAPFRCQDGIDRHSVGRGGWQDHIQTLRNRRREGAGGAHSRAARRGGQVLSESMSRAESYQKAPECYRRREFAAAAEQFGCLARRDFASAMFLERARHLMRQPPGPDWEPVSVQEQK